MTQLQMNKKRTVSYSDVQSINMDSVLVTMYTLQEYIITHCYQFSFNSITMKGLQCER